MAVLGALASLHPAPVAKEPGTTGVLGELRETVAYVRRMPGIASCIVVIVAMGFFGNPVFPMLAVFAEDVFAVSGVRYGILGAALGAGGVLATPLVAGRGSALARSRLAGWALGIYGTALVAFAVAPVFAAAVALLVVAGGGYLALSSTLNTTIQVQVDERRRGKVLALYVMGLTGSYPIGALVQGALADVVSVRVVTATSGLVLLAVLGRLLATARLQTMDEDPHDVDEAAPEDPRAPLQEPA